MANGDTGIDFPRLSQMALGIANLQERRQGNLLRERSLDMREAERLQLEEVRKLEQFKAKSTLLDQMLERKDLPPEFQDQLVIQQYQLLSEATGDVLPVPRAQELVGRRELFRKAFQGLQNPNDEAGQQALEEVFITTPDFGAAVFNSASSLGQLQQRHAEAIRKGELHKEQMKRIQQQTAVAQARVSLMNTQVTRLNQTIEDWKTFQPKFRAIEEQLKNLDLSKREREAKRMMQEDQDFQDFRETARINLDRLANQIPVMRNAKADLETQLLNSEDVQEQERIQAQLDALGISLEAASRERDFYRNPNRETFRVFEQSHQAFLKSHNQARQQLDDLARERVDIARDRLDVSTRTEARQQEKQTREFTLADATNVAQQEFAGLPRGTQTPQNASKLAAKHSTNQFKVSPQEVLKGIADPNKPLVSIGGAEQQTAFEKELGQLQAKRVIDSVKGAEEAVEMIRTVHQGRQLLDEGVITGFGAEWLVTLGQAIRRIGFDVGGTALENSQAFAATMAQNVGKIIKQFGAGTGLSDADREYAEKMVAGKITLEEKSIRRIMEIMERASRNVIQFHNTKVQTVKSNIPLTIEEPSAYRPPSGSLPRIQTDQEFDALAPGTEFMGPDGKRRRKP
jgi:hypothetical protein